MAYEELFKKIKDYESKWGKLGAGNSILNPEKTTISHSGLNSSNNFYGGKRKMLNMTNDYYEFRRKVAEGKKNNKLAHAATVDIDEINRQHWERINSDGTLIHVGGRYVPNYEEDDNYLEHAENVKYYQKIELPSGKTRYFYTKAEWDAYNKGKSQSEGAKKDEEHRQNKIADINRIESFINQNTKEEREAKRKEKEARMREQEYRNNEDYAKYAEEDRQTDMADKRERETALKKFKKEMLLIGDDKDVEKKKLVDRYIETGDDDDLRALEKVLNEHQKAVLDATLLGLQKESFMGGRIRKSDGSLRKIKHSFENDDMNESIMSEYRAFKARADRGAEMNRLTHSSFISPSELNERYEEEIASHCFLAHAGGYGAPAGTNAYVAKIDDFYGKGKPRYFYSREEYDAYQRNAKGASQAGADRASKETATGVRQNQINNAKKAVAEREAAKNYKNNEDYAQNAGKERSEKETGMDATRQKQVADAKKAIAKREADAKAKEQSANQAGSAKQGESEGKGQAEYQKQQKEKLAQERAEISKRNDAGRDAAIKAGQKSEQDRQAKEAKLDEARKTQKEAEASGNNRTQSDTSYSGEDLANALKRNTSKDKIDNLGTELGSILAEYYRVVDNNDNSDAGYKAKRKAWDDYFEKRDEIFDKYGIEFNSPEYAEAQKVVKEIEAEYEKSRELKGKNLHFKHSALDELNEFKAKVAMGKEKNRLAHSRMISLTELQHAASGKYGAPSGTNKYYAKLDDFYGKGKPRYFYTKEEWDGYQRNAKGASQAGADRAQKEKNNNDPNYQKNKAYAENAAKDRGNKEDWNAATKKTRVYSEEETNKDIKNVQSGRMSQSDYNRKHDWVEFESGEGFKRDYKTGKPTIDMNRFAYYEPDWSGPDGTSNKERFNKDKDMQDKFVKMNQATSEHLAEFYQKFCLENPELTAEEAKKEIKKYLNYTFTSGNRYEEWGEKAADLLWYDVNKKIDNMDKAWERTHKEN